MNVYTWLLLVTLSIITKKLETIQMSLQWLCKQNVLHAFSTTGHQWKGMTIDTCNNSDESQRHYAKQKKSASEVYKLYNCIYIRIQEKAKLQWWRHQWLPGFCG